ncbi:MAG: DNA topoisomerase IB [Jatrophihabitantaceae bacterium]
MADPPAAMIAAISELYEDAQRCAESAGLVYVATDDPGIARQRRGRGFSYRQPDGLHSIAEGVKQRIVELAIPPAWRDVWICPSPDGHILATGQDDRDRKQYLYHPKWRALRDLLNSYRLIVVAQQLPKIRAHVNTQLRRRTLDRDRVLASMVRIVDASGIRIGSEVYAEENDSFGLSTLTRRHVTVTRARTDFDFPAKSGKRARIELRDRRVATVVSQLLKQHRRRLFTVDGRAIEAGEVNALLHDLTGEHITAKDFRTWRGTLIAFNYLRSHLDQEPETAVLAAVDLAADELRNTRAVARAHYIHPHLLETFAAGTFAGYLRSARSRGCDLLAPDEQSLLGFLRVLLTHEYERS